MPELANAPDTVARKMVGGPSEVRQEMNLFGAAPGLPPVAQLHYAEILPYSSRIFTDESLPPIEEQVKTMFAKLDAVIGETGDVENVIGKGQYARCRASVLDCVFFRVHDGYVPADGFLLGGVSANILGRMRVMGWYCAVPGMELTSDEADRFIQSVGVRGYAVPERP